MSADDLFGPAPPPAPRHIAPAPPPPVPSTPCACGSRDFWVGFPPICKKCQRAWVAPPPPEPPPADTEAEAPACPECWSMNVEVSLGGSVCRACGFFWGGPLGEAPNGGGMEPKPAPALETRPATPGGQIPSNGHPAEAQGFDLFGEAVRPSFRNLLCERFIVPPFSILNSKEGDWQERKRKWLAMGIRSEVGRDGNLLGYSNTLMEPDPEKRAAMTVGEYDGGNAFSGSGTSIFDPCLAELAFKWYSPPEGSVLDPFAGGSVRGVVAAALGREYLGIELRPEQVAANREQGDKLCGEARVKPLWVCGDSAKVLALSDYDNAAFDMVFSCPPYGDLETYSDLPGDISAMSHEKFCESYREIIRQACAKLKRNRFAAFVVGDFRDKRGFLQNFIGETVAAFEAAGLGYLNEFVFAQPIGTWALRVTKIFETSRKCGRVDQRMLVFCKGEPKEAAEACGRLSILEGKE